MTNKKKAQKRKEDSFIVDFFIEEVRSLYWMEEHLISMHRQLKEESNSDYLMLLLAKLSKRNKKHTDLIIDIFNAIGSSTLTKKNDTITAIIEEADELVSNKEEDTKTKDINIILIVRKAIHYGIAFCDSLSRLAQILNFLEVKKTFEEMLKEKEKMEEEFSQLLESYIMVLGREGD